MRNGGQVSGNWDNFAYGVTTDAGGSVLVTGNTTGSLGGVNKGGYDTLLMKFSPTECGSSSTIGRKSLLEFTPSYQVCR